MKCDKFLELGILYFYGELNLLEKTEFEEHLKECEFCRNELNELKSISELYKLLPEEEPSQSALLRILEKARVCHCERKQSNLPVIKIFQNIPRLAFAGIGAVIIFAIVGYFVFQRPKPYLAWENGMDSKIELIEGEIYNLYEEADIFGVTDKGLLSIEERINGIKESAEDLEKELQSLKL